MSELQPPRDPKMLLTEVSARIKIKDIKRLYEMRDRIAVKWYESALVALLFVAALTFLLVVIQLLPKPNPIVRDFVIASSVALILITTAILEFLLRKFRAMRALYEYQSRMLDELEKEVGRLRHKVEQLEQPVAEESKDEPSRSSPDRSDNP